MGIADSFGMAFAKAQISADGALPLEGAIFVTVNDHDKANLVPIARRFHGLGFRILATEGTARYLRARGIPAERVLKVHEGRPNAIDLLVSGQIQLLINTPLGKLTQQDDYAIRRAALQHRVPYTTTLSAASAACDAIIALRSRRGRGALAPGVARARPGDVARVDRLTARDPGFAAAAPRRGSRGEVREARAAGAVLDLPDRRAGHGRCCPPSAEDVGDGAADGARGRDPVVRPRARLQHPAARRRAGCAGDPPGQGAGPAATRTATGGPSAPGCRLRSPRAGPRRPASPGSTSSSACPARSAAAST